MNFIIKFIMNDKKRRLNIINNMTCFYVTELYQVNCQRKSCHNWINLDSTCNCAIIAAKQGSHTFQDIGDMYGLSRMRICQIEKNILEKIKNSY
jgi:hypothetical protein